MSVPNATHLTSPESKVYKLEEAKHRKLIDQGLMVINRKTITRYGKPCVKVTYGLAEAPSKTERIFHGLKGVGCLPATLVNKDFRKKHLGQAFDGEYHRSVIYKEFSDPDGTVAGVAANAFSAPKSELDLTDPTKSNQEVIKKAGYDPLVKDSVRQWAMRPENAAQMERTPGGNGIIVIPPPHRDGKSTFIYCPGGKINDPKTTSINIFDEKGKPILDPEKFIKCAYTIADSKKHSTEIIMDWAEKETKKDYPQLSGSQFEAKKKELARSLLGRTVSIEPDSGRVYIHSHSTSKGREIGKFPEQVTKSNHKTWDKTSSEYKRNLADSHKPYAHLLDKKREDSSEIDP